jgi:hypothetical protein
VLQVRRVLAYGGVPTILEDLWLPGAPFKGLTAERLRAWPGPMYALFETEFGVRMVRAEEKIRAVLPDAEQALLLDVPAQMPLLSVERVAHTYHDTPMELRRGLYRTDTHHYATSWADRDADQVRTSLRQSARASCVLRYEVNSIRLQRCADACASAARWCIAIEFCVVCISA